MAALLPGQRVYTLSRFTDSLCSRVVQSVQTVSFQGFPKEVVCLKNCIYPNGERFEREDVFEKLEQAQAALKDKLKDERTKLRRRLLRIADLLSGTTPMRLKESK